MMGSDSIGWEMKPGTASRGLVRTGRRRVRFLGDLFLGMEGGSGGEQNAGRKVSRQHQTP
jgi:hypothetical protein